jgi:methionyl-tRNA formyltransferase
LNIIFLFINPFKASTEEGLAAQQELAALGADVMVVAAYGLIPKLCSIHLNMVV